MSRWLGRIDVDLVDSRSPTLNPAPPRQDLGRGQLRPFPLQAAGHPVHRVKGGL
jgi:hypothetical protein